MEAFNEWAIVELFGHQKIAGRISEQQIGGCSFVRVDVPSINDRPGFTRMLGNGAIYSITVTDEVTAKLVAQYLDPVPVDKWSVQEMINRRSLPVKNSEIDALQDEEQEE